MAFKKMLGSGVTIPSRAIFSSHTAASNRSFSTLRRHRGNSGIFRMNSDIPFFIDNILEFKESSTSRLQGKWLIGRSLKPICVQHDPFSDFPYLRAKLWGTELETQVEVCHLNDVETHFAQHRILWEGKNATVVVSLSRVSRCDISQVYL